MDRPLTYGLLLVVFLATGFLAWSWWAGQVIDQQYPFSEGLGG